MKKKKSIEIIKIDKKEYIIDNEWNDIKNQYFKFISVDGYRATLPFDEIVFEEENESFRVEDHIDVLGVRVKIIFYLDLNLQHFGFVYNDLEDGYTMLEGENSNSYLEYKTKLSKQLYETITSKRERFYKNNKHMLLNTLKK